MSNEIPSNSMTIQKVHEKNEVVEITVRTFFPLMNNKNKIHLKLACTFKASYDIHGTSNKLNVIMHWCGCSYIVIVIFILIFSKCLRMTFKCYINPSI